MAGDVGGVDAGPRRSGLQNLRNRIAMQSCGRYLVVTVDCAKDCARGYVGSGKPVATRLYWASPLVLAERDRDFFAGLPLIGFRTRYVDHDTGIRKAQVRHRHRTEFRAAKRSRESREDPRCYRHHREWFSVFARRGTLARRLPP